MLTLYSVNIAATSKSFKLLWRSSPQGSLLFLWITEFTSFIWQSFVTSWLHADNLVCSVTFVQLPLWSGSRSLNWDLLALVQFQGYFNNVLSKKVEQAIDYWLSQYFCVVASGLPLSFSSSYLTELKSVFLFQILRFLFTTSKTTLYTLTWHTV